MDGRRKIKIAIVTHKMVMGGIEKSLVELLKALLHRNCDVTLYLEALGGELYEKIPKDVNIIHIFKGYESTLSIIKKNMYTKQCKKVRSAICAYLYSKFQGNPVEGWKSVCGYMDEISEQYDYAFAYGAPVSFSTIFVDYILNAKRKYVWIHNDVKQISLDIKKYRNIFQKYEKIVCVSQNAKKTFIEMLPEFYENTTIFYNILNKEEILKLSKESILDDNHIGSKIVTIGRISHEKGQDIIPDVMRKLLKNGYDVKWYCVGDGEDRESLQERITEMSLDKQIILLGSSLNPYPFFREADIYVQTSRHEGFGITIAEAKMFRLPIVTTNFAGAEEQITDGETGYIVKFDVDEIYEKIITLLKDSTTRNKFRENLNNDKKSCISDLELLLN